MKHFILISILALFVYLVIPAATPIYAQDTVIETDTPVGVESNATESSLTVPMRINYELPYPGMLPDSPFYFLKVFRDGVVKMLINDDLKRAKFSLLNAEKRMYAGKMLADKNNDRLAVETIAKSNNYLSDTLKAINNYKKTHPKSHDINPFFNQLDSSLQKLLEMATDIKPLIDNEYKDQFLAEEKKLMKIGQTVKIQLLQK